VGYEFGVDVDPCRMLISTKREILKTGERIE